MGSELMSTLGTDPMMAARYIVSGPNLAPGAVSAAATGGVTAPSTIFDTAATYRGAIDPDGIDSATKKQRRERAFVFSTPQEHGGFSISLKITGSLRAALKMLFAKPSARNLGKSGRVKATFGPRKKSTSRFTLLRAPAL